MNIPTNTVAMYAPHLGMITDQRKRNGPDPIGNIIIKVILIVNPMSR